MTTMLIEVIIQHVPLQSGCFPPVSMVIAFGNQPDYAAMKKNTAGMLWVQ